MAAKVGEHSMNNTLPLENAFCVKAVKQEECKDEDFVDNKVQISDTAIVTEVQEDNLICDELKQYDVYASLDDIKTELSLPEIQNDMIHDNLKKEETISADSIRIEFNNGLLYCEDCQVYREDYCVECEMLVHILNKSAAISADKSQEELPNDILEIRDYFGEFRIFALRVIPAGVRFGPLTGTNTADCSWKIKGGKPVVNRDKSKYLNWMQYINPARNIFAQNLRAFQYEHNLYYESTRQIEAGDELLVHFGETHEDSFNRNVEMDFIPNAQHMFKDAYACTYCCLGYSSKTHLAKHKTLCPGNASGEFTIEELMQCPSCKIHLHRKEYFTHHMAYCCKRNNRKCFLPTQSSRTAQRNKRKTGQHQMYKCQQYKHRTKGKGDLKNHTKQHCEVKTYKCGICCRRFKTKGVLRLHLENIHIRADGKGDLEYSISADMKTHIKAEGSRSQYETKQFKCSWCEFRTKYKANLKRHMARKHPKKYKYKRDTCDDKLNSKTRIRSRYSKESQCGYCDYKANRSYLKKHIQIKHLKEFKYKCDRCDYKANLKSYLKMHIETRHLKEFKYKCDRCDYKTNQKSNLNRHIETSHLKEFKYKCDACDYQTNGNSDLRKHVEARHLKEFKYKCDRCDYKANLMSHLKSHVGAKHATEFKYKCDACEYKTNRKGNLRAHTEASHLKELKYKCDRCDFKTSSKYTLKTHTETRHLKEVFHKCDMCDYKANRKCNLKRHTEAIHLKEFKYKCDRCEYKANLKSDLKGHTDRVHLKEFKYKCDTCDYKTYRKDHFKRHLESKHFNT